MINLKKFGSLGPETNEGFGPFFANDEEAIIKELKSDLDRLLKQKIAVADFRNDKYSQVNKNLDQILKDLSFIVARYANITQDGEFVAKPLNEIR